MLTFEKQKRGGGETGDSEFRVYVYRNPKSKTPTVQIICRVARSILDRAGWFVGDHAIPSVDEKSRTWVLSRTADRSKGYMVTSTDKAGGKAVYLKVTATEDAAEAAVPGGALDCKVVEADSRAIVGQF